ncbi:MAG TPA: PQQ-dependent sugar dehydrogenase, partial [Anaerolineae bacterium]
MIPANRNVQIFLFVCLVCLALLAAAMRGLTTFAGTAYSSASSPDLNVTVFATGFNQPVDIAHAGDGRLFVVERAGVIRVVESDGTVLPAPFLDISNQVDKSHSEEGLLGLSFHPDYPQTPYFYVNYTNPQDGTRISRFTVSADANVADADSEEILLTVNQPQENHNGGDLNFGPGDGYLYIGLGDGGGSGDNHGNIGNGQNKMTLLGKILRINVDSDSPYTIPPDNPFVDEANARGEIWALGLRNPWRFSFDRATGDMYIGDVGQNTREEIDYQPAGSGGGENYGWRCYEGNLPFNTTDCSDASAYVFPIFDYPRSEGRAVTGGFVYRGSRYPALVGYYLFADFGSGNFWTALRNGNDWTVESHGTLSDIRQPSTFGEGCDGELYVANYNFLGQSPTAIYHIEASTAGEMDHFLHLPVVFGGSGV